MQKMIVPEEIRQDPFFHRTISRKPVNLDSIEALTPETDKKVTGTFVNIEYPGQTAPICCKYYKKMPYFKQVMMDGEKYTVPLSVARHINERCHYEPHKYILDPQGNPMKSSEKRARYKFIVENY